MSGWIQATMQQNTISVDSFDLKSMSFNFSNDIFIKFEMPRSLGSELPNDILEKPILLLFHSSVIRGPCLGAVIQLYTSNYSNHSYFHFSADGYFGYYRVFYIEIFILD